MNDEDAIEQFRLFCEDYILRHGCTGEDGGGAKRQFISRKALAAYWTREKITTVLCSRDNLIIANSETILRHYSVAFSILVLMSRPEQIHLFTRADINDSKLPLLSPPPSYPNAPEATIIGDFMRNQWKFCPLTFGHTSGSFPDKRDISPHQILPIIEKEKLKSTADEEEDDSVLYKVKLHPDCTDISDYVAFKVYAREDSETEQFYENEASMYSHLSKESFDHIVTYRGSFRQSGKRTVVLQYALGDTLQAFFKSQSPPQSFADRVQFLSNLLDLLKGLHAIQDLTRNHHHSIATHRLKGTHQDIRPQNILVCGSLSENVYCAPFKVADLGKSHIRMVRNGGIDRAAVDQFGNGMYSAPEILRNNKTAIVVAAAADLWSFGGIVSEALIWSIFGEEGRMKYQAERVARTRETDLNGGHHEGAFHDGDCLLDVVGKWHEKAIQHQNGIEGLTKRLSDLILNHMLVPDPHHRASDAALVHEYWIEIKQDYATVAHDPQAHPAAATKPPVRSQSTSHAAGRGSPMIHRSALSDDSPLFLKEIVTSPSPLVDGPSGYEQSFRSHNPTGLHIAGGLSSSGARKDHLGSRRLNGGTHFTNHHQPEPSGYRHHASPPASQTMPPESFPYNPPTQDPPVVPVETNANGSSEVAEQCVTVDNIRETSFDGGGRIGKMLNKKTRDPLETFPSLKASLKKVKVAEGRDQIFLIDDSVSMKPYRKEVAWVSRVLGYVLKKGEVDPDGFELFFASSPASAANIRKTTQLQVNIERHGFAEPQCEIGPALDEIVTGVISKDKPVSIYVLTNGHWDIHEKDPSCGVEGPVGRLTKHIRDGNKQRNWAVVQFVRFYNVANPNNADDLLGQARLSFLDDELTARLEHQLDIVDTRDFNTDVGSMLLGAISPKVDKNNSRHSASQASP